MQWRQSTQPQFQRTRLPRLVAPWLHLIHTEPGRQLLPSERDEADLNRQQRQGEGVPGPGGQGEAEVLLDRGQRERPQHQVAQWPEVQQRQMVQHWRVSWSLFTQLRISVDLFLSPKLSFQYLFSAGRAQPDNREGDENCLAVLNNFYDDGVR